MTHTHTHPVAAVKFVRCILRAGGGLNMFQMSKVRQWQHVEVASILPADMATVCQCSAGASGPFYWGDDGLSISVTHVLL